MGEFIPFEWCRIILSRYGISSSMTPGTHAQVFEGAKAVVGLSICYEEAYGGIMRENRKLGADVLVNMTNDAWFPNSILPQQHFTHARLRTVENGVPLLRSCNTGVTVALDSLGRVVKQFGDNAEDPEWLGGCLAAGVSMTQYNTLYMLWGDGFVLTLSALFLTLCLPKLKTKN